MKTENKFLIAKASNKTKTIIFAVAAAFSLVMVIGAFGAYFGKTSDGERMEFGGFLAVLILFAGIAAFSILKLIRLRKQKKTLQNYRLYIARLSNDKEKSMEKVARGMCLPLETVESDINTLIKMDLIKNAYIDNHTLVLPEYDLYDKIPDVVLVTVKCDCCGGNSQIPENTIGSCQFCGSPVSAKQ
ncbi:MAG: hypothetical protein II117_07135 [Clostridia bacterium]|nr:hypothetical protein [Clostridia bacterium]